MLQDILKFAQGSYIMLLGDEALFYIDRMNRRSGEAEIIDKLYRDGAIADLVLFILRASKIKQSVIVEEKWLFDVNAYIKNNMDKAISVQELVSIRGIQKPFLRALCKRNENNSKHLYYSDKNAVCMQAAVAGKKSKRSVREGWLF